MNFDKKAQIARMQPSTCKLIKYLEGEGISFSPTDGKHENIVLTSKDMEVKISHHSFYRYSGISVYCRDKGENLSETVEVTDEMYVQNIMKPIVQIFFKIK